MSGVVIRPRRDDDLPPLVELLALQQAETQYPLRWPWPGDLAEFIRRPSELDAWVAVLDDEVVGHAAVETVPDDELGQIGSAAHGVPVSQLRCVSVLFADRRRPRRGIGSALLARATDRALAEGGAPILDVVSDHHEPVRLYEARGWRQVGRFRPDWLPASDDPAIVMIYPRAQPAIDHETADDGDGVLFVADPVDDSIGSAARTVPVIERGA